MHRAGGDPQPAKVVRLTKTRAYLKTSDHLIHTVHRKSGEPCGGQGVMKIVPEDLPLLEGKPADPPVDKRVVRGRPNHWVL